MKPLRLTLPPSSKSSKSWHRCKDPKPNPASNPNAQPCLPELPRVDIHHEPDSHHLRLWLPVKAHRRRCLREAGLHTGRVHGGAAYPWQVGLCTQCQTLIQAPVPAQIIDKGIPTAGLLAQVLVAKYSDHLPLYRQERIFGRAGVEIPRSTLAQWVGICGVQLQPLVDALKTRCSVTRCCMPMRRRWPCSSRATRKPTGLTLGLCARSL
jgi:hypothetical protein